MKRTPDYKTPRVIELEDGIIEAIETLEMSKNGLLWFIGMHGGTPSDDVALEEIDATLAGLNKLVRIDRRWK